MELCLVRLGVFTNQFLDENKNLSFESSFTIEKQNLIDNWVMYVYDFQHSEVDPLTINRVPYTIESFKTKIDEGNMRINIYAYYRDHNTSDIVSTMLLPSIPKDNKDNDSTVLTSGNICEFPIPVPSDGKNYNPFFIATCPYLNADTNEINWYDFNGNMRNILVFDKILTNTELERLFDKRNS